MFNTGEKVDCFDDFVISHSVVNVLYRLHNLTFIALLFFWIAILLVQGGHAGDTWIGNIFTDIFIVQMVFAISSGFIAFKEWGGSQSYLGKAFFLLSASLLMQFLGHMSYTLGYRIANLDAYPGIGESFFILCLPPSISGAFLLFKNEISVFSKKLLSAERGFAALIIIVHVICNILNLALFTNYIVLSEEYIFIRYFTELVYPTLQVLIISLLVLFTFKSRFMYDGVLSKLFALFTTSLLLRYVADSLYLFDTHHLSWYPAGLGDLIYLLSYFLSGLSLFKLVYIFRRTEPKLKVVFFDSDNYPYPNHV